jgi:hypothetical protein
MLRTLTGEQLDAWFEHVRARHIRAFQGFVLGIERDKAAVKADQQWNRRGQSEQIKAD